MNETGQDSAEYGVRMACLNCGCERTRYFKKGKEVPRKVDCPNCGCCQMVQTLSTSSEAAKCLDVFFNGRKA